VRRGPGEDEHSARQRVDQPKLEDALPFVDAAFATDVDGPGRRRADLDDQVTQRVRARVWARQFATVGPPLQVGTEQRRRSGGRGDREADGPPPGRRALPPPDLHSKVQHRLLVGEGREAHDDLTLDELAVTGLGLGQGHELIDGHALWRGEA